jgi:hypothetical protein
MPAVFGSWGEPLVTEREFPVWEFCRVEKDSPGGTLTGRDSAPVAERKALR